MEKKLFDLQDELHRRGTEAIRRQLDQQHLQLDRILLMVDDRTRGVLSESRFLATMDNVKIELRGLVEMQTRSDKVASTRHDELLGAIERRNHLGFQNPMHESPANRQRRIDEAQEAILSSL